MKRTVAISGALASSCMLLLLFSLIVRSYAEVSFTFHNSGTWAILTLSAPILLGFEIWAATSAVKADIGPGLKVLLVGLNSLGVAVAFLFTLCLLLAIIGLCGIGAINPG